MVKHSRSRATIQRLFTNNTNTHVYRYIYNKANWNKEKGTDNSGNISKPLQQNGSNANNEN